MAVKGTIQFKDGDGNDLTGPREDGSSLILDFNFGVILPFDAQGKIQGQRSFAPFTITKEIDQLTPQLAQIICTAARCSTISVFLFRIEPTTGLEKMFFTYLFEDAHIVQQTQQCLLRRIITMKTLVILKQYRLWHQELHGSSAKEIFSLWMNLHFT